jgi:integrase
LTEITAQHIERWVWKIDCSAATRAKIILCLSGIYRRARRVWGITYNPIEDVERPQLRPTFEVNVYTPAEVLALLAATDNLQDRAILITAACTGLRLGELVALRWRDVDLDRRVLRVCGSWSGTELTLPKNGKVRSVPLAPHVLTSLRRITDQPTAESRAPCTTGRCGCVRSGPRTRHGRTDSPV